MSDLIDRYAATQTALKFIVEYLGGAFDEDLQKKLMERMNDIPSAQPEIIHCKDCKYIRYDTIFNQAWCNHQKGVTMVFDDAKEHCGRAERKTDGNR